MPFKLHHTNRNKQIGRFRLWPLAYRLAKNRYNNNPGDPSALKWLQVAQMNYVKYRNDLDTDKNKAINLKTDHYKKIAAEFLSFDETRYGIITLTRTVESLRDHKKLSSFLYPLLKRAQKYKKIAPYKIPYLQYFIHKYCEKNPLLAALYLKDTLRKINTHTVRLLTMPLGLFEVKGREAEETGFWEEDITEEDDQKDIIMLADDIESALKVIPSLPININLTCYLLSPEPHQDIKFNDLNMQISVRNFFKDLMPFNGDLDQAAIKTASHFSKNLAEIIVAETKVLGNVPYKQEILDPLALQVEDIVLPSVRKMTIAENLTEHGNDIIVVMNNYERNKDVLEYLVAKKATGSRFNLYFSKNLAGAVFNQKRAERWFRRYMRSAQTDTYTPPEIIDYRTAFRSYKKFMRHLKTYRFKTPPQQSYTCSYLNTIDPSYKRAAKITTKHIADTGRKSLIFSHNINTRSAKKYISSSKDGAPKNNFQLHDVNANSFRNRRLQNNIEWHIYLLQKVMESCEKSQIFFANNVSLQLPLTPQITTIVGRFFPNMMLAAKAIDTSFKMNKPNHIIATPGRNYFTWLLYAIGKNHNVPTIDLQVLFQSAYGRYKESKADIFGMINGEQLKIYKDEFGVKDGQSIEKIGSLLFSKTTEKYNALNAKKIKKRINIGSRRKVITFASQYLIVQDCIASLDAILPRLKQQKNFVLIIKTHPKEREENLKKYQDIVKKHKMRADTVQIKTDLDIYDAIKISDLIITLFSNVGMEAGLFDKDVWSININKAQYPCDITSEGLVANVNSKKKLTRYIDDWFGERKYPAQMQKKRAKFFRKNPEQRDAMVLERLFALADDLAQDATH